MAEKFPTVSVVITAYNYAQYLSGAIDSVLAQTYQDVEIIVVDDGSTDDTATIISPYLKDSRIQYIWKKNGGQASAKNRGIKEAKGKYIAFLDADDIWFPIKLERQIPLFLNPRVGVAYSKMILIDKEGYEYPYNHSQFYRGNVLNRIFIDNFICFSSSIVRKECFEKVSSFNEDPPMSIDYDLWIRIACYYDFDFADTPLVKYRFGHGHMSDNIDKRYECALKIMNRHLSCQSFKNIIAWWVPFYARAHTYGNMAYYYRLRGKKIKSFHFYLKSLSFNPFYLFSWLGLGKLALPDKMIRSRLTS